MRTGCRWTGRLDGDVCFELRLSRADFRREQAGSVSSVAPTDDNIFVHRTCFRFTCCTTSSYHATSKNIRERVHGIITRRPFLCLLDPWLISLSLLPSSLHFHSFFSFFDLINQGIRGENERISDRRNDDGGDELSSMHKECARSRVFRPRNSGRRESLIITLSTRRASLLITRGSGQLLA